MKLNDLMKKCSITAYGFKAIQDYCARSNPDGNSVIVATDSPATMYERGIGDYFAPLIPRNSRFVSADDVRTANLDVQHVAVFAAPADKTKLLDTVIVSRHQGTVEILRAMYPLAPVLAVATPNDVKGKHIIGTLPPALISECAAYTAVTIVGFDYARDGDLSGKELLTRLKIYKPIMVVIG